MFCYKCDKNININTNKYNNLPEVFDIMNYILNNLDDYISIYNYLLEYKQKDYNFWTYKNKSGITVFHLLVWYIGIQTVKYKHFKHKILKIFIVLFGINYNKFNNNLLEFNDINNDKDSSSLVINFSYKSNNNNINNIIKYISENNIINDDIKQKIFMTGTNCDPYHTIFHHLNQYCENKNDIYYKEMYYYLLNQNSYLMNEVYDNNNKTANDYLNQKINNDNHLISISNILTSNYKNLEKSIIYYLESKDDTKLTKCQKCKNIIDFSLDIPNIINYAFDSYDYVLINMIIKSYQYRSLLNNIYISNHLYDNNNENNYLSIDNRHNHIINLYKSNIQNYINIDSYISIIE